MNYVISIFNNLKKLAIFRIITILIGNFVNNKIRRG
nr:MAG TPA: hypothetical protein [Caudoviricetes sp.]